MSKSIGAYTVIQALVRDGEAYLAKSADGRKCTIVMVDVAADDERLDRVRAETLACAALHHPAVAVIADVFDHEGKTAIVGPEPLDGTTLAALIDKRGARKLTVEEIWYIGLQIAAAISLAHSTEVDGDFIPVCHGHLSPAFVEIGFDGTVRVEGLGLGQLAGEEGLAADERYIAPEQRGGGRITPRGDIYSVAAILWELLAGHKPRSGMSVADVAADVPDAFADAFGRALEEKVGNRRITSMELEQFLGELVDEAPGKGKKALVSSMAAFKKGRTLLGHAATKKSRKKGPPVLFSKDDKAPSTRRGGTGKLGGALGGMKVPPLRSKQNTLPGGIPARVDWDAASKAAHESIRPEDIDDDLSWGGDEDDNLAALVATPSAPAHDIEDEDSDDEELTMMNPAGVELRAAMDQAKAKRDRSTDERVDTVKPPAQSKPDSKPDEDTLIRSRKKLERQAKRSRPQSDPPVSDGEDVTVMRDRPELPSREEIAAARERKLAGRASSPGAGPPRPRPSNRSLPRPSDPGRLSPAPPSGKGAKKSDFMKTMASAGVDEDAEPARASEPEKAEQDDVAVEVETLDHLAIGEGDDVPARLGADLDSAVIPLPAPPDSTPSEDGDEDDEPIFVDPPAPAPVAIEVEEAKPASVQAQPPSASASAPSPWKSDADVPAAEAEPAAKPLPKALAAVIIVVTAVVVMVIGVIVLRQNATVGPPPSLASGDASGPKKPKPKPSAKPATKPSAKPSAAPGGPSATTSATGAVAPPEVDASKLPATMGYLKVVYAPDAEAIVSALGKDIGKVGVPNQVTCTRPVFVRLKSARGIWLNTGQPVNVKCQDVTTVEVK